MRDFPEHSQHHEVPLHVYSCADTKSID